MYVHSTHKINAKHINLLNINYINISFRSLNFCHNLFLQDGAACQDLGPNDNLLWVECRILLFRQPFFPPLLKIYNRESFKPKRLFKWVRLTERYFEERITQ